MSQIDYDSKYYREPKNKFKRGQCTWHCFGRAMEQAGKTIKFNSSSGNHAKTWLERVTNCEEIDYPVADSIAVFNNHVVYIEDVDTSNDTIEFTEAHYSGHVDGELQEMDLEKFKTNGYRGTFLGFLEL